MVAIRDSAAAALVRDAIAGRPDRGDRLARACSIGDLRRLARRRLPKAAFDYLEGGAEDEVTLRANTEAFSDWALVPRVLEGLDDVDLSTTVTGMASASPIVCAPTGFNRLFHPDGEIAVARAAAAAGLVSCLSTMSTRSIEEVAASCEGPRWFQLYVWRDRSLTTELVERARNAKYGALCLTVDTTTHGRRERDLRNGLTIPPTAGLRTVLDGARRPAWWLGFLRSDPIEFANVASRAGARGTEGVPLWTFIAAQFDPRVTWDDAADVASRWGGPFVVKGIHSAHDARRAVDAGATAVVVSNHGGRQLDHAPATLRVLPEVVDAVGDRAEVLLDGGVRRGTDVVKALALGARGVLVGRAYLYGLAAAGEAGVARAIELLHGELRSAMVLLGRSSVAELGPEVLRRAGA